MPPITRTLVPAGCLLALAACAPIGGLGQPVVTTTAPATKYRAMILSTVSSGLQVGSQGNVQPQTQIGTNSQQLFVFVFGNNNVVTVDQTNLMPFLNLNWVNQAMGQTQIAGDVTSTSNTGSLQWDPNSLTTLLGAAPAPNPSSGITMSQDYGASPTPNPTATAMCPPVPTPTPTSTPTPTPTPTPTVAEPVLQAEPTQLPPTAPTPGPTAEAATGSDLLAVPMTM